MLTCLSIVSNQTETFTLEELEPMLEFFFLIGCPRSLRFFA